MTTGDGSVVARLATGGGGTGPALVEFALHESVRWRIQLRGGTREKILDLRSGLVDEVHLAGGATRAQVTLPPAVGTVRVRAAGGAGVLTVDGKTRTGVAGGTKVEATGWADAEDRYDIDAVAGVSKLVVERS
ncbi:hypothetical protein [Micromonospora sp. M71_S20]|uniref:hypothetical protein n=1 Tax=Micromonospora sp. M71_S20 TaxID=592872 RepID=UPI000EAFB8B7|nr:hypothetical protein [Micromonospora sp. M71_S20]